MEKLRHLTKNDANYVPSYQDLNLDEASFGFFMQSKYGMSIYDKLVQTWIDDNCRRIVLMKGKRIEKNISRIKSAETHWYNVLSDSEILAAINLSRLKVDSSIDGILRSQKNESLISYYNKLRERVKHSEAKIPMADINKLKRFPKYNKSNGELFGCDSRMVALWSHVFSLRD